MTTRVIVMIIIVRYQAHDIHNYKVLDRGFPEAQFKGGRIHSSGGRDFWGTLAGWVIAKTKR